MVDKTFHDANVVIPLPAQKIYLTHSQAIVQDISNVLITREKSSDVAEFYYKHHDIEKNTLHTVDWDAIQKAFDGKHSLSYKKTFHNLRNTFIL